MELSEVPFIELEEGGRRGGERKEREGWEGLPYLWSQKVAVCF